MQLSSGPELVAVPQRGGLSRYQLKTLVLEKDVT